jgi:hypothetical protein
LATEKLSLLNKIYKVTDFDMILLDYNILIIAVSSTGYQARAYQLTTMIPILPLSIDLLVQTSFPLDTKAKISCRPTLKVSLEFDCVLQASDYYVYNFQAMLAVTPTNTGEITNAEFFKYFLPDTFSNGRCDSSLDFIVCESDVRNLLTVTFQKGQEVRRKLNIMTIYAKINSQKYPGSGYSSRMKVVNNTFTFSDRNFNVDDYIKNSLTFVGAKVLGVPGKSDILTFTMDNTMTLNLNFTSSKSDIEDLKKISLPIFFTARSEKNFTLIYKYFDYSSDEVKNYLSLYLILGGCAIIGLVVAFLVIRNKNMSKVDIKKVFNQNEDL